MTTPPDFDELIAADDIDAAISAARFAKLEAEFKYALRHDTGLLIDIARAAAEAAQLNAQHLEDERRALDPATAPEEAERLRRAVEARRRRRAAAYAAIGQPVP